MSVPTTPILEQQIAQLEAQLAQLKKDQTLLHNLNARKEELQKELHRVNAQIARVTGKVAPTAAAPAVPTPPAAAAPKPTATPPAAKTPKPAAAAAPAKAAAPKHAAAGDRPSLADLILACLKEAKGKPVSVRQLTDETLKRGFTTTSSTPYRIVESRIQDLSKKGVVAHAKDQPGWVLGKGTNGTAKPTAGKANKNGVAKVAPSAKKDNTPAKGSVKRKRG